MGNLLCRCLLPPEASRPVPGSVLTVATPSLLRLRSATSAGTSFPERRKRIRCGYFVATGLGTKLPVSESNVRVRFSPVLELT